MCAQVCWRNSADGQGGRLAGENLVILKCNWITVDYRSKIIAPLRRTSVCVHFHADSYTKDTLALLWRIMRPALIMRHTNATCRVCTQPWCTLIGACIRVCTCVPEWTTHVFTSPWAKETAHILTHTEELPQSVHDLSAGIRWSINKRITSLSFNLLPLDLWS